MFAGTSMSRAGAEEFFMEMFDLASGQKGCGFDSRRAYYSCLRLFQERTRQQGTGDCSSFPRRR